MPLERPFLSAGPGCPRRHGLDPAERRRPRASTSCRRRRSTPERASRRGERMFHRSGSLPIQGPCASSRPCRPAHRGALRRRPRRGRRLGGVGAARGRRPRRSTPTRRRRSSRSPVTPAGNAFAVYEGGTLDAPLLLSERVRPRPCSRSSCRSPGPRRGRCPATSRASRTPRPTLTGATAAASGDGAGVIALRYGASLLTALVREPGREFDIPATLAGGALGRIDTARRERQRQRRDRRRLPRRRRPLGHRPRALQRPPARGPLRPRQRAGRPPTAPRPPSRRPPTAGPSSPGRTAPPSTSRASATPAARPPAQRLGASRSRGPLAAAVGLGGDGVVAWIDTDGYLRLVRRSAPGAFSYSLPIHRPARGVTMSDLAAAVDPQGPRVRQLARDAGLHAARLRRPGADRRLVPGDAPGHRHATSAAPSSPRGRTAAPPSPGPPRPAGRPSPPRPRSGATRRRSRARSAARTSTAPTRRSSPAPACASSSSGASSATPSPPPARSSTRPPTPAPDAANVPRSTAGVGARDVRRGGRGRGGRAL